MGTTASITLSAKVSRLRQRTDFQRNPVAALWRRIWWRLRWALTSKPWHLKLGDDVEILAPKGGAGALIYYQGYSEPETASAVKEFLKPGMTFWDVGAHIGEYSLLAARCVGVGGHVDAFEPQPEMFAFLQRNVIANGLGNVTSHCLAVSDREGLAELSLHPEPSMSFLNLNRSFDERMPSVSVRTTTLDEFWKSSGQIPNLVKVDVEGLEKWILTGAQSLLGLPAEMAPALIMEIDEGNCSQFGYHAEEIPKALANYGFEAFWIGRDGSLASTASESARPNASNVLAMKRDRKC